VRVLVTGGTGFIGVPLCRVLRGCGHALTLVSRDPEHAGADAVGWEELPRVVREVEAIVNLAGEPIAAHRWRAAQKRHIIGSRVESTRALVQAVSGADVRPRVLVSGSAIGYYGAHGDEPLDETAPPGEGFLAEVCQAWEREALAAEALGMRVVRLRIGVVLAPDGGALARMVGPFRAFVGGPIGRGTQWMSWIHRDDVIGLVVAALENDAYGGAVNATAPQPVMNAEFAAALGRALVRPARIHTPSFVLRLALGEMATMLLTGQRVLPAVANRLGYPWRYADVRAALRASVRRN
jgi:uncharacterized protein (TIGR01777 family)